MDDQISINISEFYKELSKEELVKKHNSLLDTMLKSDVPHSFNDNMKIEISEDGEGFVCLENKKQKTKNRKEFHRL